MKRKSKKWDKEEEGMLRAFYHLPDGIDYLMLVLQRPRGSIWMKAMRLGLQHYMFYLRDNLSVHSMKLNCHETTKGCWEWRGPFMNTGYGSIMIDHKTFTAHRVMFSLANPDESIEGFNVNHHCDNPACINPAHLYKGTQRDNIQDQFKRGRHRWQRRNAIRC